MRKYWIGAIVVAALLTTASRATAERASLFGSGCACECEMDYCNSCDPCGGHGLFGGDGHGHGHGNGHFHKYYEGRSAHFNCGCNGSYKFPVPPLYTYHWPGMWSHQLMTDYHSPWRFPPLKPYVDEPLPVEMGIEEATLHRIRPVSLSQKEASVTTDEPRSFSSHVRQLGR
jgi:hypothetical protein